MAQKHRIETHGLLWIFEELIHHTLITPNTASTKLGLLFEQNSFYRMNPKLMNAWEKMKKVLEEMSDP